MKRTFMIFFLVYMVLLLLALPAFGQQTALAQAAATATATVTASPVGTGSAEAEPSATALPPTVTLYPAVISLISHEPTPVGYGPDEFPLDINPLTGKTVADPDNLNRRPMIVKITNYPRTVRPQTGLSRTDIVYEYYMQDGIPRFLAVFYGTDAELAGPIRSGRFFDEHVFKMYDGPFVFGYADPRIMTYFQGLEDYWVYGLTYSHEENTDSDECDIENPTMFCRDDTIVVDSYNNLFVNTDLLEKNFALRGLQHRPDLTGMRFAYRTPAEGKVALTIRTRYSLLIYNKWEYDINTGRYLRFQENIGYSDPTFESYEPLTERLTGEQLGADNVVVLVVPYHYFLKTHSTEIMNTPLYGEGPAYVFRDGYMFEANWIRPQDGGVLQLFTPEGEPYPLKPGQTWFQVFSPESEITEDAISWGIRFVLPEAPNDLQENPINPDAENAPFGWFEDQYEPAVFPERYDWDEE